MKKLIYIFVLILFISVSFNGCSSINITVGFFKNLFQKSPVLKKNDKRALVYVVRPNNLGAQVRFRVFVNSVKDIDNKAGWTLGREYIYFYLKPGNYTLYSIAGNLAQMELFVRAGQTYFVEQKTETGESIANNTLSLISPSQGASLIKKSQPGIIIRNNF